ncbi:MAG: hydantoinase/oxoprolinase N-terminal domain-containing protein, partial [Halobacteriota archaeon]
MTGCGGSDPSVEADAGVQMGVDVGGTFTDVVTIEDGTLRVLKTPSTPEAPEQGVLNGLAAAREDGLGEVTFLAHGTTVATNAVLEGEWAETAL